MKKGGEASLRWRLLKHHLLSKPGTMDEDVAKVSRRPFAHFGIILHKRLNHPDSIDAKAKHIAKECTNDIFVEYTIPTMPHMKLLLLQRRENGVSISDFNISEKHQIDNTGIVGLWPAEEVLTFYCVSRTSLFRGKRVLELGSGYGLAGLAIAACTDAAEVLLTDANPQVVEYLNININQNAEAFGDTQVRAATVFWSQDKASNDEEGFDIIVAADCTFFDKSHLGLACTVKRMLKKSEESQALFFGPRRGRSLNLFIETARSISLNADLVEQYDPQIWQLHQQFLSNSTWPNYTLEHCYPLLLTLTHTDLTSFVNSNYCN